MAFPRPVVPFVVMAALASGCAAPPPDGELPADGMPAAPVGSITGFLIDDVYRPVAGATVDARPEGGGEERSTVSLANGTFVIRDIPIGRWVVRAHWPGGEAGPQVVDVRVDTDANVSLLGRRP